MIVEDGTGVAGANSYASEADFEARAEAMGVTPSSGDVEAALVFATAWIDGRYRRRFPGSRTYGREQALQWPRADAFDADGNEIADDEIPGELVAATVEVALRRLSSPDSLYPLPASASGQLKSKRVKLGSLEKAEEYVTDAGAASGAASLTVVDDLLGGILTFGANSGAMITLLRA